MSPTWFRTTFQSFKFLILAFDILIFKPDTTSKSKVNLTEELKGTTHSNSYKLH